MSGLVLKLGPKERVLINGAVIENGDRRSRLSIVTPGANILRLRDAIHPEERALDSVLAVFATHSWNLESMLGHGRGHGGSAHRPARPDPAR